MPKVLLAVESTTIRRLLELTFSGSDTAVVAAGDGEEAIARIPSERPDVVLADIALPRRSGYEVAAFVKNDPALSRTRVLLLAGAFEPADEARAAAVNADGVLEKPFEPQDVRTRVEQLLARPPAMPPGATAWPAVLSGQDPVANPDDDDRPVPTVDRLIGEPGAATGPVAPASTPAGSFDLLSAGEPILTARQSPPPIPPPSLDVTQGSQSLPRPESPSPGTTADALAALVAFDEGTASGPPVRQEPSAPVQVDQDMIDEITRRVIARLAPGTVKDLVADVVSDVAERLVREEIERIRRSS